MTKNTNTVQTVQTADPTVTSLITTKSVFALALAGKSRTQIRKELKLSPALLDQILQSDDYKKLAESQATDELLPLITETRKKLGKLLDKAVTVLEHNLDQGELQAAVTTFKLMGLLDEKKETAQDTTIQVILPSEVSQVIEVTNEENTT